MHRIPLRLKEPSIHWDRNEPEHILFERTLNEDNVRETSTFVQIISEESSEYLDCLWKWSDEQLQAMQDLEIRRDVNHELKILEIANCVIFRAPFLSTAYSAALKIRGYYFFESYRFEDAASDLMQFLNIEVKNDSAEDYCKVNGILAVCFYIMRKYGEAKKYVNDFKKYKGILPDHLFTQEKFGTIEAHILQFAPELKNVQNIVPRVRNEVTFNVPIKGFNLGTEIPLCSKACYQSKMGKDNKNPGVYLECDIAENNHILVEDPILRTLNTPYIQCEVCFKQSECMYSCHRCHYKTYCSDNCMNCDKATHQYECLGYKELIIMIMDASSLFRMFIRTSEQLHLHVFTDKVFRNVRNAAEVMQKIDSVIIDTNLQGRQHLNFLVKKPDYNKLLSMQYSTLVATAFRLTIFIDMDTDLIATFYNGIDVSNKQKMIIIGSILMRLHCHLLNNIIDFQYKYPMNVSTPQYPSIQEEIRSISGNIKVERNKVVEDGNSFYNLNMDTDVVARYKKLIADHKPNTVTSSSLPQAAHTLNCGHIQRLMSTYKDNLIELFFNPSASDSYMLGEAADMCTTKTATTVMSERIFEMNDLERCFFVQKCARMFHENFAKFFIQRNRIHNRVEQIISLLCATVSKIQHSCSPNVEIIVLKNGFVMGKTLRDIKKGEELVVSHKAHFMRNTRWEREQFFKRFNFTCTCEICTQSESKEVMTTRQGIVCECNNYVIITPTDHKCWQCYTSYNNLLLKYRSQIKILADAVYEKRSLPNTEDHELYTAYMMLYMHSNRLFVPSNEYRIRIELEVAKYLALKNFAKQAYDIVMRLKEVLVNYDQRFLNFTFHDDILTVIKIIFHYNLDEKLLSISIKCLQDLCSFGTDIVENQRHHLIFYEVYNTECGKVLRDLRSFLDWKEKILVNDILPLSESLRKLKQKNKHRKSNNIGLMPQLSRSM